MGSVVVSESLSIETDRPRPKNGVFNSGGYFRFFHVKKSETYRPDESSCDETEKSPHH